MKKLLALLLALTMILALTACNLGGTPSGSTPADGTPKETQGGTQGGKENNGGDTVKTSNWKKVEVKEYQAEDFAAITADLPEPESTYTINAIGSPNASGLMFDFEDEAAAKVWVETLISIGFEQVDERFGVLYYGNGTHRVKVSGYSITVTIED